MVKPSSTRLPSVLPPNYSPFTFPPKFGKKSQNVISFPLGSTQIFTNGLMTIHKFPSSLQKGPKKWAVSSQWDISLLGLVVSPIVTRLIKKQENVAYTLTSNISVMVIVIFILALTVTLILKPEKPFITLSEKPQG